jgi:hypothetical protein
MLIFRVERSDKVGPYMSGGSAVSTRAQRESNDDRYSHPLPEEDEGLKDVDLVDDHHFGFVSMEQLEDWWPSSKWYVFRDYNDKNVPERRYGISEYEVPVEHVEVGTRQLMFRMREAHRLCHTPFHSELATAY